MKTRKEVIKTFKSQCFDKRDLIRLSAYLKNDECEQLGLKVSAKYKKTNKDVCKEWTEENIIGSLLKDAEFGFDKARQNKNISSPLMFLCCKMWIDILDDEEIQKQYIYKNYFNYGVGLFSFIISKYKVEKQNLSSGNSEKRYAGES
jgi:hypothetical protein